VSVPQLLRIVIFLVMPVASGVTVIVGKRKRATVHGWKGNAIAYGPIIGATSALLVFMMVMVTAVLAGH
jgi:hypothetical protein